MDFIRKTWVNKEDVPEAELNQHPCFDAKNMNRIEGGIEEALTFVGEHTHTPEEVGLKYVDDNKTIIDIAIDDQVPDFERAPKLENLKPGEDNISTAFGKIKKAIADFMTHKSDGNPHNITPAKIEAAESNHTHSAADVGAYTKSEVNSKLTEYAASNHTHTPSQIGAAPSSHNHDDRYYTETEVNNLLANKAPAYSYGTEDLVAGQTQLATGKLHFVYE